jgi:hypothetical protein
MRRILPALILFILLASSSAGASLVDDVEAAIDEYSPMADEVPLPLKQAYGNEVMHVTVTLNDGSMCYLSLETADAKVTEFGETDASGAEEATLLVTTDEDTVYRLIRSPTPLDTFYEAYDSGKIGIEATDITGKITLAVADAAVGVSKLFGFF